MSAPRWLVDVLMEINAPINEEIVADAVWKAAREVAESLTGAETRGGCLAALEILENPL